MDAKVGEYVEPEDPKKKLEQLLEQAEKKGTLVAEVGRKLTEEGQNMSDVAEATRQVVQYAGYIPDIEKSIIFWEAANNQADNFLAQSKEILIPPLTSGTATAAVSSTDLAYSPEILKISGDDSYALTAALANLSNVVTRASREEEVIVLMKLLGLDVTHEGKKSALEQFQIAHESFSKPVIDSNPVITSLIPMRESVRLAIDYLLKHRPKQEVTKKEWDKIISIGNQLSYSTISQQQITSWAGIWISELKYSLSPAKEDDISRDEWTKRITKSTLFLKSFLSGIDPTKLR